MNSSLLFTTVPLCLDSIFFHSYIIWLWLTICIHNCVLISVISAKTCSMKNAAVRFLISIIDTAAETVDTTIETTAEMITEMITETTVAMTVEQTCYGSPTVRLIAVFEVYQFSKDLSTFFENSAIAIRKFRDYRFSDSCKKLEMMLNRCDHWKLCAVLKSNAKTKWKHIFFYS